MSSSVRSERSASEVEAPPGNHRGLPLQKCRVLQSRVYGVSIPTDPLRPVPQDVDTRRPYEWYVSILTSPLGLVLPIELTGTFLTQNQFQSSPAR